MTFKNDVRGSAKLVDGKRSKVYESWRGIQKRCKPGGPEQRAHPSYVGVTASPEFERFSSFHDWFNANYIEGYAIDKDILQPGNKIYSPSTCVFVPTALNNLLTHEQNHGNSLPTGVSWHQIGKKFEAKINLDGKRTYIGLFATPEAASLAYVAAKVEAIEDWKHREEITHHSRRLEIVAGLSLHQNELLKGTI